MSFSCDVNVLLYASDQSSPYRERAQKFLAECAEGTELFCLTWSTVLAYLRISTHSGIFRAPLSPAEARSNVQALEALPHVRFLGIEGDFWKHWDRATEGAIVRGNLVPDAELAATLLLHGIRVLYSNDSDFRKFAALEVRNPFQ